MIKQQYDIIKKLIDKINSNENRVDMIEYHRNQIKGTATFDGVLAHYILKKLSEDNNDGETLTEKYYCIDYINDLIDNKYLDYFDISVEKEALIIAFILKPKIIEEYEKFKYESNINEYNNSNDAKSLRLTKYALYCSVFFNVISLIFALI